MSGIKLNNEVPNPLLTLIDLGHRARGAAGADELAFLLVNDSRALVPYRQAALWFEEGGVRTLSGVVQPDGNAPYAQWLDRLCRVLSSSDTSTPQRVIPEELPPDIVAEWGDWLPQEVLWLPLAASPEHSGSVPGGLLLAGEMPLSDEHLALLAEWLDIWRHAWLARFRPAPWSPAIWRRKIRDWRHGEGKWWQFRPIQLAMVFAVVLLFPVRLTVLAPGELVPANPAVIRAPLDGVIGQIHVRPNEPVKSGQLLFSFDEAPIASRLEVARQGLATAEAEYRQLAQLVLTDVRAKGQLAVLLGKIGEKRAEAEFLESQFQRSRVVAPQAGIAIFDDPSEWIGRPVQTGERVMRVATPEEVEIEAWLAIGDAIPLAESAPVSLYLAASPFSSISGQVRYLSHDASPRPDGTYAYRVRAALEDAADRRIGLKGTAKLHGRWVPFAYWVLRRPLASIRQFLAF